MDFDPRDYEDARDPRDTRDWDERDRGHDDDALSLGRGPGSSQIDAHHDRRDRDDDSPSHLTSSTAARYLVNFLRRAARQNGLLARRVS